MQPRETSSGSTRIPHPSIHPPAVTDDMLFYGSRGKRVIALDADTGEFRWEFVAEANPTMGSALVEDGVVYIGSGDENIYAAGRPDR